MSKVYSTEELIEILASERQACLKGDRLKLDVAVSGNPVIDQFIQTDGLQRFTAYQDFKAAIHNYQRENLISGVVWREITIKGQSLRYPEVDTQLISLFEDLEILKTAKESVIDFWDRVTGGMEFYLSFSNGKQHQKIDRSDIARIALRSEWATLWKWENSQFLEIILQLGWGLPEEACYKRGRPKSGSEYIHAVMPGNQPIG